MRVNSSQRLPPENLPVPQGTARRAVAHPAPAAPVEVVHTGEVLPARDLPYQTQRLVSTYAAPPAPVRGARAVAAYAAVAAGAPPPPALDLFV